MLHVGAPEAQGLLPQMTSIGPGEVGTQPVSRRVKVTGIMRLVRTRGGYLGSKLLLLGRDRRYRSSPLQHFIRYGCIVDCPR